MDAQHSQLARHLMAPLMALNVAYTVLVIPARSAIAADIPAIMAGLEANGIATADQLLALSDEANDDPAMIHALVSAARAIGRQGHWKRSILLLVRARELHDASLRTAPSAPDSPAALVHTINLAIASAAMQCGDIDQAIQNSDVVVQDAKAPEQHRAAAYPLLIKAYHLSSQLDEACQIVHRATEDEHARLAAGQIGELALAIGSDCLQKKQANAASVIYQDYLKLVPDGPRVADAKLGAAWAAALGADPPAGAAKKLEAFVSDFPKHHDAPHALRAAATCFDQANQSEKAEASRSRLLDSYPHSEAAGEVLAKYASTNSAWPVHIRTAWKDRLSFTGEQRLTITQSQIAAVLSESFRASDDQLWQKAVNWLVDADPDGAQSETILRQFTSQSQEPLAEHLAVDLIARADDSERSRSPAASEAACRWAGASERWSMLALAAEELGAPSDSSRRSAAVDRMLAESLMQIQRPDEAMKWWDWLIDARGADDFATLLRGAETSIAHGEIETAVARIDAAKHAAGGDAFHQALIQVLSAELSIRRARFDEARETLSEVVRDADSSAALRPRAQWMIGETHFLQQRYAEAIDAYRRVDAMDSAGQWAPAALLQAGKAFEKLGRGRDAAVCYTALLRRFSDWPHATLAQSRLATLAPSGTGSDSVLR